MFLLSQVYRLNAVGPPIIVHGFNFLLRNRIRSLIVCDLKIAQRTGKIKYSVLRIENSNTDFTELKTVFHFKNARMKWSC